MSNVFLSDTSLMNRDVETALLLEKAIVTDIGNAVAYTDGDNIFINTEENLERILPKYDQRMLKWLLWHERMHKELKHHERYFKCTDEWTGDKPFNLTHEEVNIIMDILVHDWMSHQFPDLVNIAKQNCGQFRNQNSLRYTFKGYTLEDMLKEYSKHKKDDEGGEGKEDTEGEKSKTPSQDKKEQETKSEETKDKKTEGRKSKTAVGEEGEGKETDVKEDSKDTKEDSKDTKEDTKEDTKDTKEDDGGKSHKAGNGRGGKGDDEAPSPEDTEDEDEHDKTDWSKLGRIDRKEFLTKSEGEDIMRRITALKNRKLRLSKLTETLNSLSTTTRKRSYAIPSPINCGGRCIAKR